MLNEFNIPPPPSLQVRVNAISAGPLGSRAAKAIGFIDDMIRWGCWEHRRGCCGGGSLGDGGGGLSACLPVCLLTP